jgi:hypothetical protein
MAELPDIAKAEVVIVEQTNAFRSEQQQVELKRNPLLDKAARAFAQYLAKSGRFAHEADGRQPADRVKAVGYDFCTVAENLASNLDSRGFTTNGLAGQAMDGWKKSLGHRANLLLSNVTEIGVGVAQAPGLDPKFLSVQLFGRPLSLAYEFRIINKSHDVVTYSYGVKSYEIEPLVATTHRGCEPGDIVFKRSGNWLTGARINATYKARKGALYVLKPGPDGRVHVHLQN